MCDLTCLLQQWGNDFSFAPTPLPHPPTPAWQQMNITGWQTKGPFLRELVWHRTVIWMIICSSSFELKVLKFLWNAVIVPKAWVLSISFLTKSLFSLYLLFFPFPSWGPRSPVENFTDSIPVFQERGNARYLRNACLYLAVKHEAAGSVRARRVWSELLKCILNLAVQT